MKNKIKGNLNTLQLSDVYSLMLFVLYKVQDIPDYAVLSELCYLLDGRNITRLLTYFAGKTIKIPSESEMVVLINALLLYQYINIDDMTFVDAQNKINNCTKGQLDKSVDLYLKILPVINNYNIDRSQVQKNGR